MPMEIPTLPPPVGFQLVRDPSTGQFLFLPAATTIGNYNFFYIFIFLIILKHTYVSNLYFNFKYTMVNGDI